jgi:phage baseplate assembly protein W
MAGEKPGVGQQTFLGRGWSFPPQFDLVRREVVMSTDERDIEASLRILLGTTAGERLRHPTYGLNLQEQLFEPMNTTLQTLLKDRVKTNLLVFEPRINVLAIDLDASRLNEGCLLITINYQVRATNSRFNLVYPYYLHDGNEVAAGEGVSGT